MKVLFLHAEVMGYTLAVIREMAKAGCEIVVVSWDTRKLTTYELDPIPGVTFLPRSTMSSRRIIRLSRDFAPDLVVVSGWQDWGYLPAAYLLRRTIPVVTGLDGQPKRDLRHLAAFLLGRLRFFSLFFSHAWVAGPRQHLLARLIGFKADQVIFDLYSADVEQFNSDPEPLEEGDKFPRPRNLVFAGRLVPEKGLASLVRVWKSLGEEKTGWNLIIAGSGPLAPMLEDDRTIFHQEFMKPEMLSDVLAKASLFVLPSYSEPWGVVVHEAAASGLPLILSDAVGASDTFLIHGYNGFKFKAESDASLRQALVSAFALDESRLREFGSRSRSLSSRINPELSAMNIISLIGK
jgi:glycosyltransferase involved in cell wall biosynthesis